ncbi:HpcH/HpaI aldolase/citrate lyase family protein [Pseudahrensia aquimaris]|uniref:HpcH/HpaI aldolase/citrate lyase family protein n=1 Tax=Pseudahrensia aquimaris TaxID=744461 RepID=A0ABW3FJY9_9HYPH
MKRMTDRFADDGAIASAWTSIQDTMYLDFLARTNFGAITLDMQHGMQTEDSVIRGIMALGPHKKPVVVRIPVGRFDFASKALDAGAHSIIAPMINTVEDAKALVSFTKYIPVGDRSYGPTQAVNVLGVDRSEYVTTANDETVIFAMIETKEAVSNMEAILDLDGIDGVFCGPADLSISVRGNIVPDPYGEDTIGIVENMAKQAKVRGKIAAAFCADAATANMVYDLGFRFLSIGFDSTYLDRGANSEVAKLKF